MLTMPPSVVLGRRENFQTFSAITQETITTATVYQTASLSRPQQKLQQQNLGKPFNTFNELFCLIHYRICDSHNLNASPLCQLSGNTILPKWGREVKELYGDLDIPDYISTLATPMRDIYEDEKMKNEEMLDTLTKVT